jgi:2-methylisocitrate lyase-like PEP mutase family enzyme
MSKETAGMSAAAILRKMLADKDKIIVCPGIYDGFTARIALQAGFDCLYMVRIEPSKNPLTNLMNLGIAKTGAGTTMSRLGMADLGVATLNDMKENAEMIAGLDRTVPLIADADTGYGGKKKESERRKQKF